MRVTTKVLYSCPLCGLVKAPCEVTARGSEDVVEWVQKVMIIELSMDHARRSPGCRPKELKNIMIPTTGTDKIGGPVVQ